MKRCVVFAHFDPHGIVDDYVITLLESLRKRSEEIIFVSTSAKENELAKIENLCSIKFTRENIGYDFLSWKTGIEHISSPEKYDEIVFVNDSIYGPIGDLDIVFSKSDELKCDFWGLTRCHIFDTHIQSFFFSFRKKLIHSGVFSEFWGSVKAHEGKMDIVKNLEVGMTNFLNERNVSIKYIFDPCELNLIKRIKSLKKDGVNKKKGVVSDILKRAKNKPANPMHHYWRTTLESGVPFIKVDLIKNNPNSVSMATIQKKLSKIKYDTNMIERHQKRIAQQKNINFE